MIVKNGCKPGKNPDFVINSVYIIKIEVKFSETLLGDQESPQELSHCLFAYKRIDAKIAWPKTDT